MTFHGRAATWVVVGWAAVAAVSVGAATPADDGDQAAVQAGRKALDRWWPYPWYDRETDDVRLSVPKNVEWSVPVIRWIVWTLLGSALAGLVWVMGRAAWRQRGRSAARRRGPKQRPRQAERQRLEALPIDVPGPPLDLLGDARRFYRQGDFSQAIVYLFSYQLLQLDQHRLIRLAPGKTNRQYLGELRGRAALQGLVARTVDVFEETFFGNRRLGRQRFEACWRQLDQFHGFLAGGAP